MSITLTVTVGWGIELPDRFYDSLGVEFYTDSHLLELDCPYHYDYEDGDSFAVLAKSTVKTFYGTHVNPHYNPPLPTAQEVLALKDLQDRIGYDAELKPLMVVSLG